MGSGHLGWGTLPGPPGGRFIKTFFLTFFDILHVKNVKKMFRRRLKCQKNVGVHFCHFPKCPVYIRAPTARFRKCPPGRVDVTIVVGICTSVDRPRAVQYLSVKPWGRGPVWPGAVGPCCRGGEPWGREVGPPAGGRCGPLGRQAHLQYYAAHCFRLW